MWLTLISLGIRNTVISAQTTLQIHFHVSVCKVLHWITSTFEHCFNCTFTAVSSSRVQVIHAKPPYWSLRPPRPLRPPWASHKSPQCYSNNRPRDKEHIYTSGAFFESKKALFGRFPNSPSCLKKQKTKPVCPSTPYLSIPQTLKKFTIPVMETWEPNILHQAQSHPPVHKHPQFHQTPSLRDKSPLEAECMWGFWWIP